ncbi:peptidoglycan DD-metalloendopeptidase family protein [Mangrovimonas sp. DI 80]|uniref:peptidoglycan DD-metalloendopeptidase family protein n=1 Tax=Mangrovimonas sp. DI 80 TaxID=1779330 RepID=UPI0009776C2A|nr:peptidoglycan DD-metalloendopeptidase family protein [Mangrovimonas sp. DI 80]OMP31142.1 peptidase M23 [Mangrovimonas sp. DI 80]
MTATEFSQLLIGLGNSKPMVLDTNISRESYVLLDLSKNNALLQSVDVSNSSKLEAFVNSHLETHNAKVAFGGYLEERNIYQRSTHFKPKDGDLERSIHLGMDFWAKQGTGVYAPLAGRVHSFQNNTNFGDYGPTIILEHNAEGEVFYTLYGHLSLESLETVSVGKPIEKGEVFASLGAAAVNGDYPPHLHFQIIRDLQGKVGDYPGVCHKLEVDFYRNNCPDPNFLLQL